MSETLQEKTVITRKPHKCEWCGEGIGVREKAIYVVNIFDGEFGAYYLHPECDAAMDRCDGNTMRDEGFEPYDQTRGKAWEE